MYQCSSCETFHKKWHGQCPQCKSLGTLIESDAPLANNQQTSEGGYTRHQTKVVPLNQVKVETKRRIYPSQFGELNRVLNEGFVKGSVILISGNPGAGKSTLLLQAMNHLASQQHTTLYVSAEESLEQIFMRAKRLKLDIPDSFYVSVDGHLQSISQKILSLKPSLVVIDSIQAIFKPEISGYAGSVGQVRECALELVQLAKSQDITIIIVGHVTKEGQIAGPKVLEHCVDVSLSLEQPTDSRFHLVRSKKNRFGSINELGIFSMQPEGLVEVKNPSSIFISTSNNRQPASGLVFSSLWEGTRPLLIEVQALVDETPVQPRRMSVGIDNQRFTLLIAIAQKYRLIQTNKHDCFVNIVGGLKVEETATDLACILAMMSSFYNKPFNQKTLVIGEVGLSGEIRPVAHSTERITEATRHGFERIILPTRNCNKALKKEPIMQAVDILDFSDLKQILAWFKSN